MAWVSSTANHQMKYSADVSPSLAEIMSEQLAAHLQSAEESVNESNIVTVDECLPPSIDAEAATSDCCANDFLMATLLQHDIDMEHDEALRRQQNRFNGRDKVSVSFDNYMHMHQFEYSSDSSDEDFEKQERREIDTHRIYNKGNPDFGASGFIRDADGRIVTKHDKNVTGETKYAKVMQFPPDFPIGDAIDIKLDNKVYNVLKAHSNSEEKRQLRHKDKEEKATSELAVDVKTRLILFKLVGSGLLSSISGAVATGKESVVLHAYRGDIDLSTTLASAVTADLSSHVAIKVYKTVLSEFKNRSEYVRDDFRFKNPRRVLKIWAEKEFQNLNRMRRCGLPCPQALALKKHVLVMSFIGGDDGRPAPQLKTVKLSRDAAMNAFEQCRKLMHRLYVDCKLVHGDLSEFNILYLDGHCWLIDVSQSVDVSHANALPYLVRDIRNMLKFFGRTLDDELPDAQTIFNEITGITFDVDNFDEKVQQYADDQRYEQRREDKMSPADCLLRQCIEEAV